MTLLRMKTRTHFRQREVQAKVQQATFRSLGHAGGAIRLTAARSIRRRKKPSLPGTPPHTPTGHLKRVIRYEVDEHQSEVVIGPANEYARTIWNLHEFGGTTTPKIRVLKAHRFRVGEYGPVRRGNAGARDRGLTRAKLTSQAQADRATRLVQEENALRLAGSKRPRRYPKRPFMGPSLERMQNRLPSFWQNSVKA